MSKKVKNKGGRPSVMTKTVVHKLEEAFAFDSSDHQACFYAGISTSTLYNYQNKNPEFLERKELLKTSMGFKAKQVISKALDNEDSKVAMWLLERKEPKTYSSKYINKKDKEEYDDLNRKVVFITKEDEELAYEHIKSVIGEENM